MGQNPIPGLPHFPSNNRVSSLVRLPEIPSSQIEKEESDPYREDGKHISFSHIRQFYVPPKRIPMQQG